MRERWIMICAIVGVAVIAIIGIQKRSRDSLFSAARWKAETGEKGSSTRRLRMLDDLLTHYVTNGVSRTFVLDLLGPNSFSATPPNQYLWYHVSTQYKPTRLLYQDTYLVLEFNEREMLTSSWLETLH